jgi:hypothetical protein
MKRLGLVGAGVVVAALFTGALGEAGWRRRQCPQCACYQSCPQFSWQGRFELENEEMLQTDKRRIPEFTEEQEFGFFDGRPRRHFTESDGDTFTVKEHHRGLPKTRYAQALVQEFSDLRSLIRTLPSDRIMNRLTQKNQDWNFDRIGEEQRNVRVVAYLFAVAKEKDNDFHLIVDDDGDIQDGAKMNVEVSGIPSDSPDVATIRRVRNDFKAHFEGDPPTKYTDASGRFPFRPKRVLIEGSLFFDTDHPAGTVGPEGYRPKSAWEIHPVRRIEFLDD